MPSKKKNRGKQRKLKEANDNFKHIPHLKAQVDALVSQPPAKVVEAIRLGRNFHTLVATNLCNAPYLRRLVSAGLIPTVLQFFKQCENENILNALPDESKMVKDELVRCPMKWVALLVNVTLQDDLKECRLQIADGIAPLIKCMRNDHKRELFRSKTYWYDIIGLFMTLLTRLMNGDRATIKCLFKHEGLMDMVIRSMFWNNHRKDILEESETYQDQGDGVEIVGISRLPEFGILIQFVLNYTTILCSEGVASLQSPEETQIRLKDIATTIIVNESHDPSCKITFVVGLLHLLKTNLSAKEKDYCFTIIQRFIAVDFVDKDVIRGVVDLGCNFVSGYKDAVAITRLGYNMLNYFDSEKKLLCPIERHYAYAISVGVIEMCVNLLLQFENCDNDELIDSVRMLFNNASLVALHKKTSKAISDRRNRVSERLEVLEVMTDSDNLGQVLCALTLNERKTIRENDKLIELVRLIRSIVDKTACNPALVSSNRSCLNCSIMLEGDAIRRCGKCEAVCYCSRECQVEDWNSHKHGCKHMNVRKTLKNAGCNNAKELKEAEAHSKNKRAAFMKLFSENINNVLMQAILQGWDILDCIVLVDFRSPLPTIQVVLSRMLELVGYEPDQLHYSYQTLEKNRSKGKLTCIYISYAPYDSRAFGPPEESYYSVNTVSIPPCEQFGRWAEAQAKLKCDMANKMEDIRSDSMTRRLLFGLYFCSWFDGIFSRLKA